LKRCLYTKENPSPVKLWSCVETGWRERRG